MSRGHPEKRGRLSTADAAAEAGVSPTAYMPQAASEPEGVRRSLLGQALYDTFARAGARAGAVWILILVVLGVFAPFLASSHPIALRTATGEWRFPLLQSLSAVDACLVIYFTYAVLALAQREMSAPRKLAHLLWPLAPVGAVLLFWYWGSSLVTLRVYRPDWLEGMEPSVAAVLGWIWVVLINIGALGLALSALAIAAAVTVAFVRGSARFPVAAVAAVLAVVAMITASFTVRAPSNVVYERYREMEEAGQITSVFRTLIPYSPNDRLRDRPEEVLRPPSAKHWLGTTEFGEDMLSRMLYACRIALAIGLIATSISVAIGIIVGGLMGYYAGTVDLVHMRLVEIVEAIPTLILLLIVTVFFGRSLYLMMIVIGLVSWTGNARFIRAEFLKLRNLDFVQAAMAAGLSRWSIIFRHMLPNGISPVLVSASFGVAGAILLESVLSFLGLGLGPDDPSWGQMLEQARKGRTGFNWWIATFPGAAIFLTVFSYVLIGESMRDALDPKLRKRE